MRSVAKRLWVSAVAVLALAAVVIAPSAQAKSSNPGLVPANSAYVLSIPDVPAFWSAWKGNAIYATFQKVMASPEVTSALEGYNQQVKTIEGALGFRLNGDSLSQVFSSLDVYVRPGETAGSVISVLVFNVKDMPKLNKLVDLAEKAVTTAANRQDDASTGSATQESMGGADKDDAATSGTVSPIVTETHGGVPYKCFKGSDESEMFYAIIGQQLIGSNDRAEIKAVMDRIKTPPAENFFTAASTKAIEAKLSQPAEVFIYVNNKQAMELQQMPANMEKLGEMMKRLFAGMDANGVAMKINPKDITMEAFGPLTAGQTSPVIDILKKNPPTKPLEILGFVPEKTMVVFATNLVDAKMYFDLVAEFFSAVSGQNPAELEKNLQQAEPQLGFSVKNDLLPALGNEMAFLLNSIKMGGGMPEVDAALIFRVGDKTRIEKVLGGVEKLAATAMGAAAGGPEAAKTTPAAAGFKSEKAGDATVKYLEIPNLPTYSPSYAIAGDYLIISTTREGVKKAAELKAGKGQGLLASADYKSVSEKVSAQANVFQYVGFAGIWDAAAGVANMIPGAQAAGKWIDHLRVFQVGVSNKVAKEDGVYSTSVLKLQ